MMWHHNAKKTHNVHYTVQRKVHFTEDTRNFATDCTSATEAMLKSLNRAKYGAQKRLQL